MLKQFTVRTICGSMRYADEMLAVAIKETQNGVIILMPFVVAYAGCAKADEVKTMLDDMHKRKIDMSDGIIVVGAHIGESTSSEIQYAIQQEKQVLYWSDHFGAIR